MRNIRFYYPEGKKRALTMSYDDGREEDYRLVEIFNRYGVRGTFHLNSGRFEQPDAVKAEDVKTLFAGHEVSCHSVTHPFLERLNSAQVISEMLEDRRRLEQLCGYPVTGMSYPFGTFSSDVIKQLSAIGIVYSRTVKSTESFSLPDSFMEWDPTCHHRNPNLMTLAERFLNYGYTMSLFYVWGHSYEFTTSNNWELIEEFCSKVSGNPDTWYATNIEIVRYITALKALVFDVDSTMVYNPSSLPVYFTCDDTMIVAKPGETTAF